MAGLSVYLGHASIANTYWYLEATPVLLRDTGCQRATFSRRSGMTALAPHLSAYLREHLPRERAVSPHTVKTYANCFVLLVQFAADRLKRRPTDLEVEDLGTDMIMAFLDMWRSVAAAACGPAMAGSPRSDPSSDTSSTGFQPARSGTPCQSNPDQEDRQGADRLPRPGRDQGFARYTGSPDTPRHP
jgi:hypothetical protein